MRKLITMANEAQVEEKFVRKCKALGCTTIKLGQNGWPDRIVVVPGGLSLYVELKAEGCSPRALQLQRMATLRRMGAPVAWFDNSTDAIAWVEGQL